MFAFMWSSHGRKPEYPEETHLSDMVTVFAWEKTRVPGGNSPV